MIVRIVDTKSNRNNVQKRSPVHGLTFRSKIVPCMEVPLVGSNQKVCTLQGRTSFQPTIVVGNEFTNDPLQLLWCESSKHDFHFFSRNSVGSVQYCDEIIREERRIKFRL